MLFILICCVTNSWGQNLYFNHLSVNNGLSQGVNNCIYRDSKGFVWIGSDAGLNFYNRPLDRFQNFRIESPNTDKQFSKPFYIDDKNNIWIEVNSCI